ncbi:hypothetical protein MNBD_GAMMA08-2911 [hydrothermal vent metagenome]|uniref:Lipopolysaccharide export system protein LptC n=1 Tax=hydrothermal vent metagenome TaxID=652676 RepID=A0A3B0Y0H5_9ZZZZ
MRTYITLAIFIVIALGSFWFLQNLNKQTVIDKKIDDHFPDYFMDDFTITNLDKKGQPEYVLHAKKMQHYSDDDKAELIQPFLKFAQNGTFLTLNASRAIYLKQDNLIYLHDNVIIHRAASKTQTELFIYTDYLKINTLARIAETDRAAKIKTPDAELNTIGLILDSIQGTVILQSQVKGTYEATH